MSDPRRILEDGTPFERLLLVSSDHDAPSKDLESKIIAALAVAPHATSIESAGAPAPSRTPGRFFTPRRIGATFAVIGLGVLMAGSIMGGRTTPPPPPVASAGNTSPVVERAVEPASPAPADAPRTEVVVTPDSLPSAPAAPVAWAAPAASGKTAARTSASSQVSRTDSAESLGREVELLDAVKTRLGAGQVGEASAALDTYNAEFPQGTLRPEATVLRIRILLAQGRRAEAQKLADEFLAKQPGSVHGKRIRALLAD